MTLLACTLSGATTVSCPCSLLSAAACTAGAAAQSPPPTFDSVSRAHLAGSLSSLSFPVNVRTMWPFSAALAEHDYARLASVGGGSSHVSIEMGERRVSDVSDDTL